MMGREGLRETHKRVVWERRDVGVEERREGERSMVLFYAYLSSYGLSP
jgi:hypothetical protein